ncbi:MAG: hypothetical protein ABJG88_08085, partial [Litorimonas sp.]
MPQLTLQTWNHILTLMAAIIVSDNRIRHDELESFVKNVRVMSEKLNQDLELSDDDLSRWFTARCDDVSGHVNGPHVNIYIVENIMALEPFFHKEYLLNCLIDIAASDAELHKNEIDIINIASA